MEEAFIVDSLVKALSALGFKVATEVANFNRSADIAVVDNEETIWIIECKVSNISRAIEQLRTHKLSADKVFIGTFFRKTKKSTLNIIKKAGVGLIYIMPDGSINNDILEPRKNVPWYPARDELYKRIKEAI